MKLSVNNKNVKQLLKKYSPFLSRNDLGKIFQQLLERPKEDLDKITQEYITKKYSIKEITDLIDKSGNNEISFKKIMQKLGISKTRFYFRLNYIKRYYIKNNIDLMIKKAKILKTNHKKQDEVYIKKLLKHKKQDRYILMNPGPVMTTNTVKNAMIQYDICHRDEDFSKLLATLKKNCLKLFKADENYKIIFISGSGTAGLEAVLSSTIPPRKKVLVISNGAFGERLKEILDLHNIPTTHLKYSWAENINLQDVKQKLRDEEIYAIAMNHHETSVGLLNPVNEIGSLAKKHNAYLIVDAISSLGAEKIDVKQDNISACITSANKCIHSVSGISIICIKNSLLETTSKIKPRNYYLDLHKHHKYLEEQNQTPYTPNVISFYALNQAVKELLQEGTEKRRKEYIKRNSIIKNELMRLGFKFLTNYGNESHAILTIKIPENIDYKKFYNQLKKLGFLIYDCKPPLKDKYFQIANMGNLNDAMIYDFIFCAEKTLRKLKKEGKKCL